MEKLKNVITLIGIGISVGVVITVIAMVVLRANPSGINLGPVAFDIPTLTAVPPPPPPLLRQFSKPHNKRRQHLLLLLSHQCLVIHQAVIGKKIGNYSQMVPIIGLAHLPPHLLVKILDKREKYSKGSETMKI